MEERLDGIRINKHLADRAIATRRGADELIAAGKVFINGRIAVLGDKVLPTDVVEVRGAAARNYRYLAYYKPAGVVTVNPTETEQAIADCFSDMDDLFPIGRLDKETEGLIILTNDGRVTDRLLNPAYDHEKEYAVTTETSVGESFARKLAGGVTLADGTVTKPAKVEILDAHHFHIILTEGKNHQVKRMTEVLDVSVKHLKRIRIENIKLGDLSPNTARELVGRERSAFLKRLGL